MTGVWWRSKAIRFHVGRIGVFGESETGHVDLGVKQTVSVMQLPNFGGSISQLTTNS